MLVFEERGKPEYLEKNLLEQGENHQQTQPKYDAGSTNQSRATLMGGERSHHCTTPAPLRNRNEWEKMAFCTKNFFFGRSSLHDV